MKSAERPNSEATAGVPVKRAGKKNSQQVCLFVLRVSGVLWTWCRRCALDRRCLRPKSGFRDEQRPLRGCPGRHRRSGKNSVPPHPHLSGSRPVPDQSSEPFYVFFIPRNAENEVTQNFIALIDASPPTVKVFELDLCFVLLLFFLDCSSSSDELK